MNFRRFRATASKAMFTMVRRTLAFSSMDGSKKYTKLMKVKQQDYLWNIYGKSIWEYGNDVWEINFLRSICGFHKWFMYGLYMVILWLIMVHNGNKWWLSIKKSTRHQQVTSNDSPVHFTEKGQFYPQHPTKSIQIPVETSPQHFIEYHNFNGIFRRCLSHLFFGIYHRITS